MKHVMLAYNPQQAGEYEFADFRRCCVFRTKKKIGMDFTEGSIATIYQAKEKRIIGEFEVVRVELIDEPSNPETEDLYRKAFGEPVTLYDGKYYGPVHIFYRSLKLYSPEIRFERFTKFREQRGMTSSHPITHLNLDEIDLEFIRSQTRLIPLTNIFINEHTDSKRDEETFHSENDALPIDVAKCWVNDRVSDIIVFMKAGRYDGEPLPNIMRRIDAEYQKEKFENGNSDAFYPFGYEVFNSGEYTSERLGKLIRNRIAYITDDNTPLGVTVVFSPNKKDWPSWNIQRITGGFSHKYKLEPPKNPWKYIKPPVNTVDVLPNHYSVGGNKREYYGLVLQELELFTNPHEDFWIDLSRFRRLYDEGDWKNGSELSGKQWQSCPMPCYRVDELAQIRRTERVIAIAQLIEPYAVELSDKRFENES